MANLITISRDVSGTSGILQGTSYENLTYRSSDEFPIDFTGIVCDGDSTYVAIRYGNESVYRSVDHLQSFTGVSFPSNHRALYVRYFNSKFVVFSYDTGGNYYVDTSIDGISWSAAAAPTNNIIQSIQVLGEYLIICYESIFYYTSDLSSWTYVDVDPNETRMINFPFAKNGNTYLIRQEAYDKIYRSVDGIGGAYTGANLVGVTSIVYGNNKFILANSNDELYESVDSDPGTWNPITISGDGLYQFYGIYFDTVFGLFVTFSSGYLYTSSDGITWHESSVAGFSPAYYVPVLVTISQNYNPEVTHNYLYKTEDDIQVITIPDPPNPYQPPDPNWDEGSSGLGGDYPPQTPTRPDGNQDDSNDGNAYTYVPIYNAYTYIPIYNESGQVVYTVMCGYNGCTLYENP